MNEFEIGANFMPDTAIAITEFDYSPYSQRFIRDSKCRAEKIRQSDAEAGRNLIEMGGVLEKQRDAFGSEIEREQARGVDTWGAWCQAELGWGSRHYANQLIRIHEKFAGIVPIPALGHEMLKLLSAKSTPQELVTQVLELAEKGELPTVKKVRDRKKGMVADPRPTPTEAKQLAKETGAVVLASDDRYYTPMEEADLADYHMRRGRTYSAIDAVKVLATSPCHAKEWVKGAESYWFIDFEIGEIEAALKWLTALFSEYKSHLKVIDAQTVEEKTP